MPIEIEKKYRLTEEQRMQTIERLKSLSAESSEKEFEVNTIYRNATLEAENAIVRLRRVGKKALLTYKKRFTSESSIKRQLEEETEVADADTVARILLQLGLTPLLVYEKYRTTWRYDGTDITIDDLPFGWFMEIEGDEEAIKRVELQLRVEGLQAEEATYPALTHQHGTRKGDVIESRFRL